MSATDRDPKLEGPMHKRYRELATRCCKERLTLDTGKAVADELETIKNKFGGFPPPWDQ